MLLVAMPGAPSSVLAPSSSMPGAPSSFLFLVVRMLLVAMPGARSLVASLLLVVRCQEPLVASCS